jgi:hypothetical protein
MGEIHKILWLEGRDQIGDLGVDGKVKLKWILGKYGGEMWTGFMWLRIGKRAGPCEHGNKTSGSIKCGEFD